jgi:hypothetical protein
VPPEKEKAASLFSASEPAPGTSEPGRPGRRSPLPRSREGKRSVTLYIDDATLFALKKIALEERKSLQELMLEGVTNDGESHLYAVMPALTVPERRGVGQDIGPPTREEISGDAVPAIMPTTNRITPTISM